ncbi:MAG TPA: hypothetical protein DDY37_05045 [Legionella sp.]|nr:hypothetical protein [Legionella sp.]
MRVDTVAYYTRLPYLVTINETTTLDSIRPDTHMNDHHTTYRYNDLSQLTEEKTQTGLITTYAYDAEGHMIQTIRADRQTHEARSVCYRYDTMGRLIQSLDALGAALLAQDSTLSLDAIETIWQQHSVRYAYDIAGHVVSQTNALNETSRYVYNDDGLLVYSVSATGAVTEIRYNGFQQVETSIRYSAYCPGDTEITLQNIKQHMDALADPQRDEITHYEYNTLGLLLSKRTGSGAEQVMTYNAFGERLQTAQLGTLTDYQYDRRGLLRYRTEDVGGINKSFEVQYDAFGRVEKEWDGRQGVSFYMLNKRGEQIRIENPSHGIKLVKYDAFGRILSLESTTCTTTTYDDQAGTLAIERSIGHQTSAIVTQFNAFGDKLIVTDGNQQSTTYHYDARGLLMHIDAPEHATTDYTYDAAGRLSFQEDAGGHVHRYTYDAEGHILTKTIDPDGLNITTLYSYDAIGRQLQIIDAGRCTQFIYDNQGSLTQTRQDPDGLNLVMTFNYNENGQLMRETRTNPEGSDWVTAYTRDALGRCLTRTIDPDGLQLTTRFVYDNNDNVISQTDANNNTSHFIYDPSNRVRYRIDGSGVVTEHRYNPIGKAIQMTTYAHRISPVVTYDEVTLALILQPDSDADHHQFFAFDQQSRLMLSYDGLGYATEYTYDANDNVVAKFEYAIPCSLNELITGHRPTPDAHGQVRITRFAYDGLNHERFRIDTNGRLTESRYDIAGQLIQRTRFLHPLGLGETGQTYSVATIQAKIKHDPLHDESTH